MLSPPAFPPPLTARHFGPTRSLRAAYHTLGFMATPHASGLNLCARLNYSCDDERDAGGLSARTLQTSSASIVQPTVVMHQHAANNNNNNNNNNMGTVGSNAATYSAFQHQHLAQTRGTAQTSHANARMHFASGTTPAVGNTHSMRGSVHTNVQQARRMTGAPYSSAASGRPYQFGGFAARYARTFTPSTKQQRGKIQTS